MDEREVMKNMEGLVGRERRGSAGDGGVNLEREGEDVRRVAKGKDSGEEPEVGKGETCDERAVV